MLTHTKYTLLSLPHTPPHTPTQVKLELLNKIAAVDDIIADYEQRVVNIVNSAIFKADE